MNPTTTAILAPHMTTPADPLAEKAWLAVSAELTDAVAELCDRDDVIVRVLDGTSAGAPAMFSPATATVEVDRSVFGLLDPESIRPHLPADRYRYPAAWGGLVHEAAHAEHSTWTPAEVTGHPSNAVAAAVLLEEPRIEAAHLAGRPHDRLWLRAGTTTVVWPALSTAGVVSRLSAARAAALVLARVDAGVLTPDETEPLRRTVAAALGEDVMRELERIWRAALVAEDGDRETMLELGAAWCRAAGVDPQAHASADGPCGHGIGDPATRSGKMADAPDEQMARVSADIEAAVAADVSAEVTDTAREADREAAEFLRIVKGKRAAKKVFGRDLTRAKTRPPTDIERGAAAALAKQLRRAAYRDRTVTKTSAELPPGRLRMRGAMVRDAQRAAGSIPNAKPFTQTVRRTVERPPLRVGIAVDTSGSMKSAADPLASAAWIIASAVAAADPDSATATVGYGNGRLRAYTKPGLAPAAAPIIPISGGDERFCEAVDALDAGLGLTQPGAARLLVVVSDGQYFADERRDGAERVRKLTASGCPVLWLTLTGSSWVIPGVAELVISDPATAGAEIGRAAVKALANAR